MIVPEKVFITAVAVLVTIAGVAGPLYAATCIYHTEIDVWEVEPVEVTVDGEPVGEMQAYDGLEIQLESQPIGDLVLVVDDVGFEDDYQIEFQSDEIPEEFAEYSSEQGGE